MKSLRIVSLVFCFLSLLLGTNIFAQSTETACHSIANRAIREVETHCTEKSRSTACYGHPDLQAQFAIDMPAETFTRVGQYIDIHQMTDIDSQPLMIPEHDWGVGILWLAANLPITLPDEQVVMLAMGDTYVENDVAAANAFDSSVALRVTIEEPIQLFQYPIVSSQIIRTLMTEEQVMADARTVDGWLRIVTDNQELGWIFINSTAIPFQLTVLPIISADTLTPMQSFYFSTDVGASSCIETPDVLVIQGPEDYTVDIRANGADIRLGSTIALRTYEMLTPPQMEVIVLEGQAEIRCPLGEWLQIPEGYSVLSSLSPLDDMGQNPDIQNRIVGCDWSSPQPLSQAQMMQIAGPVFNLTSAVLNYPLTLDELVLAVPPPSRTATISFVIPTSTPSPMPLPITATSRPALVNIMQPTPAPPTATSQNRDDDDDDDGNRGGNVVIATPSNTPTLPPTATATPTLEITPEITPEPFATATRTPTPTPSGPFSCANIQVHNLQLVNNNVVIDIENGNWQSTLLQRVILHWQPNDFVLDYPNINLLFMALPSGVVWQGDGNQDFSPVDSSLHPAIDPGLLPGVWNILGNGAVSEFSGVFNDTPSLLSDYTNNTAFNGTLFYFDNPDDPGNPCEILLAP